MTDQTNINFEVPVEALDQLFLQLGLNNLSPEEKQKLSEKITLLLKNKLIIRITEEVSAEKIEEIGGLSEEETIEKLDEAGFDLIAVAIEEGLRLRQDLMQSTSYIQGFIDGQAQS